MDLVTFLHKDMVIFLENSIKFGTTENKIIADDLSSILQVAPDAPTEEVSATSNSVSTAPINVNVTIGEDAIANALKNVNGKTSVEANSVDLVYDNQEKNQELNNVQETDLEKPLIKQKELEKQIADLTTMVANQKTSEVFKKYTGLKLLVSTVDLDAEVQKKIYSVLSEAADYLNDHKVSVDEDISEIKLDVKKEKIKSLESYEEKHEQNELKSEDGGFNMPVYVEALKAIKQSDKVTALELLVTLSKQHPKNRAIKMRLREALSL